MDNEFFNFDAVIEIEKKKSYNQAIEDIRRYTMSFQKYVRDNYDVSLYDMTDEEIRKAHKEYEEITYRQQSSKQEMEMKNLLSDYKKLSIKEGKIAGLKLFAKELKSWLSWDREESDYIINMNGDDIDILVYALELEVMNE